MSRLRCLCARAAKLSPVGLGELLAGLSTFLTMTTVSSANPAGPAATGMDFGAMFVAILLSLKFALT